MRKCLRENNYTCKHCVNKFDNENDLREHISRTHGEKLYACDHCEQAFKREDMLYLILYACSACASLEYISVWRFDHNDHMHTVFRGEFDLCVLLGRFRYRICCHNVYIRTWENVLTLCKQIRERKRPKRTHKSDSRRKTVRVLILIVNKPSNGKICYIYFSCVYFLVHVPHVLL